MKWLTFVLANYAKFDGRVSRRDYWNVQLRLAIAPLLIVISIAMTALFGGGVWLPLALFGAIGSLLLMMPYMALTNRRLHDVGHSGMWIGLSFGVAVWSNFITWEAGYEGLNLFIKFAQLLLGLYTYILTCLPGNTGPNEYGPDPRDTEQSLQQ